MPKPEAKNDELIIRAVFKIPLSFHEKSWLAYGDSPFLKIWNNPQYIGYLVANIPRIVSGLVHPSYKWINPLLIPNPLTKWDEPPSKPQTSHQQGWAPLLRRLPQDVELRHAVQRSQRRHRDLRRGRRGGAVPRVWGWDGKGRNWVFSNGKTYGFWYF